MGTCTEAYPTLPKRSLEYPQREERQLSLGAVCKVRHTATTPHLDPNLRRSPCCERTRDAPQMQRRQQLCTKFPLHWQSVQSIVSWLVCSAHFPLLVLLREELLPLLRHQESRRCWREHLRQRVGLWHQRRQQRYQAEQCLAECIPETSQPLTAKSLLRHWLCLEKSSFETWTVKHFAKKVGAKPSWF